MEYNYEGIGKRIATERKEYCHLGQDELLLKLSQNYGIGMSRNTLSAIENGKYYHYNIDLLFALCELFDCELGYLLCEYDEKHRVIADIKEITGLESDVIKIILNMKNSFLKLSILNELLQDNYFLAIIDLLYMAYYHQKKGEELNKIEDNIKLVHDTAETPEERTKLKKRYDDYRTEHRLHDAKVLENRYRLTVAFARLLDERYEALKEIDTSSLEARWKQEHVKKGNSILF